MIKAVDLPSYTTRAERFDSAGFTYGVAHLQVKLPSRADFIPYWWCSCRYCGLLTALALPELGSSVSCPYCGYMYAEDVHDFDHTVDRSLRSWEMHQEQLTAAYLLGGPEAAQAIAIELHEELRAAYERIQAKRKAIRDQWQP